MSSNKRTVNREGEYSYSIVTPKIHDPDISVVKMNILIKTKDLSVTR